MTIVVRKARPDEGRALGAIGFAAWAASQFAINDAGRTDRKALLNDFEKFGTEQPEMILVAETKGSLAGWGAREDRNHQISDLWVAPKFQGQGVGTLLLDALEAEIAALGLGTAEVETLATNTRAIQFYEQRGFVVVWRGEKFSSSLGYAIDKVRMNKSLSI
jgi:[ribosomal protein S18]-alanine N-acetyltransferase